VKTERLRKNVKEYLRCYGPRSTTEILDHINTTTKNGTTTQQLGNILSKDSDIVKVGFVHRSGNLYGSYQICEWALRELSDPDEIIPYKMGISAKPGLDLSHILGKYP